MSLLSAGGDMATYAGVGVDLDVAEEVSSRIAARLGSKLFAGFLPVPQLKEYDSPVLVSSVDGVGTKVRLAAHLGRLEGLGEDIVHHCVNDIAVHGATPLFFLDYLAFHHLDPEQVETLVGSIARACNACGVRLAGGETAEMPLVYPPGSFDIAGAVVGVVEEENIVDGSAIATGDMVLGFPSHGLHTNGYSLAQRLFEGEYDRFEPALGSTVGQALLQPHRCYLPEITALLETGTVHGLAHVTGGGIPGNLSRIMPAGLTAVIELPPLPPLLALIEIQGVAREEMLRVFNMGVGLVAVCHPSVQGLPLSDGRLIGRIQPGERSVSIHDHGSE